MSMDYIPPAERTTCDICGKQFPNRSQLITHVHRKHSRRYLPPRLRSRNRGDVPCGICDMSFETQTDAGYHRRAKHGAE